MSRVIVKNLPMGGVNENEIRRHFADIDNVTDINLKYNQFGTFRRFAFVGFKSADAADRAIEKLNNTFIGNTKIVLEPCKSIRDIKPEKVNSKAAVKRARDDIANVDEKTDLGKNKKQKRNTFDPFTEVENDGEFEEFLHLHRNLGEKSTHKQIWSDDAKMNAPEVGSKSMANQAQGSTETVQKKGLNQENRTERKRQHRSRPKKVSTKTKPKELFVHTVKISGLEGARRKDIKDFFKPLELISIRINKRDEVCYVSFKDESDLRFALRKNLQFWGTSRVKIWRHDVKKSRVFKETVYEKEKEKEDSRKKYAATMAETEPIEESGRLFIRNLNYTCTQADLEQVFTPFGELTEVHFPIDKKTTLPKGYAYIEFMFPENAVRAYHELNGTIFQGRNFHIIPSKAKPNSTFAISSEHPRVNPNTGRPMAADSMSSYKRDKLLDAKKEQPKGANWNILFLSQNALADVVSDMKGVDKSKLLTQQTTKEPIAVRMALGDAKVVAETRNFLISNGIELDSFDNPAAPRSKTVIIVKNLPTSVDKLELQNMFGAHGRVARVILPPNGLTAIVEMEEPVEAKLAFRKLAYSKFKDGILYLEWAPINVFREKSLEEQDVKEAKQLETAQTGTKLLVKNVPFEATPNELKKIFAAFGELNFVRLPKKVDGQHRGFGFVDFLTKEEALRAFLSLCHSTHLYGRKLVLEWAKSEDN